MLYLKKEEEKEHESKKRTEAWAEAEFVATKGEPPPSGIPGQITDGFTDIACKFMRLVGDELLEQPRGDVDDAGGVPQVPHVRDASRGGPQMPQMQEYCFAWCHPW